MSAGFALLRATYTRECFRARRHPRALFTPRSVAGRGVQPATGCDDMNGGSPAPPDERPRRWQYLAGVVIILALAGLAYWLRTR